LELDIRVPIGLMFAVLGLMLVLFGAFSDCSIYRVSLGINLNLLWGAVMLAFGLSMLFFGRRGTAAHRTTLGSPEGRLMKTQEKESGKKLPSFRPN